eukprot:5659785-Pyramimonas_sp.AAC.1
MWGRLGRLSDHLAAVLGSSWADIGRYWGCLAVSGASGAVPGPSRAILKSSWGRLGASWAI